MSRITASKVTTLVVHMLVTSICALADMRVAAQDKTISVEGGSEAKLVEMLLKQCEDKACRDKVNETIHEILRRGNNFKDPAQECKAEQKEYTAAVEKFAEACGKVNSSLPACIKKAKKCNDARSAVASNLTMFGDEDIYGGDGSEEGTSCEELYEDCPEAGALDVKDLREQRKDYESEFRDKRERVRDLEDKMREDQATAVKDLDDALQEQAGIRGKQQRIVEDMENEALRSDASQADTIQKIRDEYRQIDNQYGEMRRQARIEMTVLNREKDLPTEKCEMQEEERFQQYIAAIQKKRASGSNVTGNFRSLVRSKGKAARESRKMRNFCATRLRNVNQLRSIEERRSNVIATYNETSAQIEQHRLNLLNRVRELEMIKSKSNDLMRRRAEAAFNQGNQDVVAARDRYSKQQEQRRQSALQTQMRLMEAQTEVQEENAKRMLARRDIDCAERNAKRSGVPMSKIEGVVEAKETIPGLQVKVQNACVAAVHACQDAELASSPNGKISNFKKYTCDRYNGRAGSEIDLAYGLEFKNVPPASKTENTTGVRAMQYDGADTQLQPTSARGGAESSHNQN